MLTTESCLLNPNRNPNLTREEMETRMRDYLGVRDIFWLAAGTEGDDTDGHIDNLARFVGERTVIALVEPDQSSANYDPLQENLRRLKAIRLDGQPLEIHEMPAPPRMEREDLTLPASYANFYITNKTVLLPTYRHPHDNIATALLTKLLPTRRVIAIDAVELIWGLGAFHCLTQQQPAVG